MKRKTSRSSPHRGRRNKTRAQQRYEQLLRLAPKMKPPQSWYDEGIDPFEAEGKPKKRRSA
jgi:hypothetical protein